MTEGKGNWYRSWNEQHHRGKRNWNEQHHPGKINWNNQGIQKTKERKKDEQKWVTKNSSKINNLEQFTAQCRVEQPLAWMRYSSDQIKEHVWKQYLINSSDMYENTLWRIGVTGVKLNTNMKTCRSNIDSLADLWAKYWNRLTRNVTRGFASLLCSNNWVALCPVCHFESLTSSWF